MKRPKMYVLVSFFFVLSGDLANGNVKKTNEREHQIAIEAQSNNPIFMNNEDQNLCTVPENSQLTNVKRTERNKFFGSLPNHLDSDETYRENGKNCFFLSKCQLTYELIGL